MHTHAIYKTIFTCFSALTDSNATSRYPKINPPRATNNMMRDILLISLMNSPLESEGLANESRTEPNTMENKGIMAPASILLSYKIIY